MWGGNTENDNTEINNLDKEINNHKGNMRGNLIWIIVCIVVLILVNIYSTNKDVIISITIIFSILLFGNFRMFFVNKYKRDMTEIKKSGKIIRINLLNKVRNINRKKILEIIKENKNNKENIPGKIIFAMFNTKFTEDFFTNYISEYLEPIQHEDNKETIYQISTQIEIYNDMSDLQKANYISDLKKANDMSLYNSG